MKGKKGHVASIRHKKNLVLPDLPFSSKKNEGDGLKHSSVVVGKDKVSQKATEGSGYSIKNKIAQLFGGKKTDSNRTGGKEDKVHIFMKPAGGQTQNINPDDFKVQKPDLKAHDATVRCPVKSQSVKDNMPDISSISARLSELEVHVMDMHSSFDEFVLQADKYMNYEQFIEMRREIEDKIKTLDKIEKSLDDSKNQIVKDTEYMDSILEGFKSTLKRIEVIEKRVDVISKSCGVGGHSSTLDKLTSKFGGGVGKHKTDSSKLSDLDKTVSELKNNIDKMKHREGDVQRELEALKEKNVLKDDKKDNDLSEDMKLFRSDIDGLKERMTGYPDSGELESMKKQICEFGARLDKCYSKNVKSIAKNGGTDKLHRDGGILSMFLGSSGVQASGGKGMSKKVSVLCKQIEDIRKSEETACKEVECMKEKMVSHEALDNMHSQIDKLLAKVRVISVDEAKLKEDIVKGIDVDEKVKKLVDAKVKELREAQDSKIAAKTNKRMDDIEKEIKSVSKDKEADKVGEEIESMRKDMVSRRTFHDVKKKVDEINSRIDEKVLNVEIVNTLKSRVDELAAEGVDKSRLKKEIEDVIVRELDVDEKVKKLVDAKVKELREAQDSKIAAKTNKRMDDIEKEIKSVSKDKEADKVGEEIESMRKDMVSRRTFHDVKKKVDEINSRIDEKVLNVEIVNTLKSRVDEMSGAKSSRSEEFTKRQDELKREIAMLKRDIKGMSDVQDSMKLIRDEVNNLKKELRNKVDEKSMEDRAVSVRNADISEIKDNIEKLKAMSQDL